MNQSKTDNQNERGSLLVFPTATTAKQAPAQPGRGIADLDGLHELVMYASMVTAYSAHSIDKTDKAVLWEHMPELQDALQRLQNFAGVLETKIAELHRG